MGIKIDKAAWLMITMKREVGGSALLYMRQRSQRNRHFLEMGGKEEESQRANFPEGPELRTLLINC